MRSARTRVALLGAAIALLAACGGGGHGRAAADSAASTSTSAAPATAAPTTAAPETTIAPTTIPETTIPETTIPETTVPETTLPPTTPAPASTALPKPIVAPVDSRGAEPVIQLGSIEIPKIGLNVPMYEGIRLTTLDRGPGHWPGTAMPGQNGNVVVAGHRVSHAKPFRMLDQLVPGDEVIFTTSDGRFVYTVTSTEIVSPDTIRIVDQTPDPTATLFACHPPGSTRQRIVVHLAFAG